MALTPQQKKELKDQIKETEDLTKKFAVDMKIVAALVKGTSLNFGKIVDLAGKLDAASKKEKKFREDIRDITKEVLENAENIGTEEFKSLDVATKLAKARRMGERELVKQLTHLKSINQQQKQQNKEISAMVKLAKQPFESIDSFIRQIPVVGDLLADVGNFTGLGDSFANGIVEGATSGMVEVHNEWVKDKFSWLSSIFRKSTKEGVTSGMAETALATTTTSTALSKMLKSTKGTEKASGGVFDNISGTKIAMVSLVAVAAKMAISSISFANSTGLAYKDMLNMLPALLVNASAVKAFAEELGTVDNLTTRQALNLKIQAFRYGLTAESAAKLFAVQRGITGSSMDQFLALTKSTAQLARMAGVAPSKVFEDMAQNAEFIAKFSDATGNNMKKTAVEAQRLGINLSTVDKIAESLLDFETSIGKEMEAAMLLGRNINMDKARELFYTGKTDLALQEVAKQLGVVGNLSELDFVQRKAISALLGTEVAELSKIIGAQEGVNEATKKTVSGAVMLGIGLGAAAGLAAAIIPAMISTIPGLKGLGWKQLGKGLSVVAAGAGAGGVAGGLIGGFMTESKGKLPELASGGVIVGEKGPELVAPIPANGVKVDNRKMEGLLGQMLIQYEFLMNRLYGRVDALAYK